MFDIYLDDLFSFLFCDVCNFAGDAASPYVCDKDLDFVLAKLEEHSSIAKNWFEYNFMKMNSNKCHLFIYGNKFLNLWGKIGKYGKVEQSNS